MKQFTTIAMKCTQENWNELKPYLDKYGFNYGNIGDFEVFKYLINNRFGKKNNITNYMLRLNDQDYKDCQHNTFKVKTFLNACGVELDTHEITIEQIKELHEIGNDAVKSKLTELFSDVLVKGLEVGKWYKEYKCLIFITRLKNKKVFGYGFDDTRKFLDDDNHYWGYGTLTLATTEEITEALKNEAVKQGIWNCPIIDTKGVSQKYNVYTNTYSKKENLLWSRYGRVFDNGIWATIIQPKTITIEQAEKRLAELGENVKIG